MIPGIVASQSGSGGGTAATTWNPADTHVDLQLSSGDLTVTKIVAGLAYRTTRATTSKSSGKWYFEVLVVEGSTQPHMMIGVAKAALSLSNFTGFHVDSVGLYQNNGQTYKNNVASNYGLTPYAEGDVVGVALDLDNGRVFFSKNGTWMNSGDPAAGTNPAYSGLSGTWFPAASPYNGSAPQHVLTGRFASADQTHAPPSGFTAWGD